jgi:thiol-disulfide isomerase/thioredoxin
MIERAVLVLALFIVGVLAYRALTRYHLRRAAVSIPTDPILLDWKLGIPAVVYFTTPMCIPCRTQQQPALARLQSELGEAIQIFKVDAAEDPAAAERWGVFTAPTTFVLDGCGQPREVNHGVADAPKLRRQIEATKAA